MNELQYKFPEELTEIVTTDEFILVDPIENDEVKRRGIIMPFTNKAYKKGVVLKVGPGKKRNEKLVPVESEPNDIVLYDHDKAKKVSVNARTFYLVKESEGVLAKVGQVENGMIDIYGEI